MDVKFGNFYGAYDSDDESDFLDKFCGSDVSLCCKMYILDSLPGKESRVEIRDCLIK